MLVSLIVVIIIYLKYIQFLFVKLYLNKAGVGNITDLKHNPSLQIMFLTQLFNI